MKFGNKRRGQVIQQYTIGWTVAEVGKYKKEIAYHGDTINTASRIQGKCNELNQELLISENLQHGLCNANVIFDKLDSIELKGKESETLLYAVRPANSGE